MKKIIYSLMLTVTFMSFAAKAEEAFLSVDFQQANSERMQAIKKLAIGENGVQPLVNLLNELFKISPKGAIKLVFSDVGNEGDSGPYTDLDTQTIVIPYQFIAEVKATFERANGEQESEISSEIATMDAVFHTLLHESAHVMIAVYGLPVVGKEEDAADSLATFILSEYFEDGEEIALSAADLFDFERQASGELTESNYWDEHSLDAQRFYSTVCHVYGSNLDKYADLLTKLEIDADRQAMCIEEYDKLANSWEQILSPWLKPHTMQ